MQNVIQKIVNLDQLKMAMVDNDPCLPQQHGEADWTSLPSFGGAEPSSTEGVWSWDETRLLVGTCTADLEIIERVAA